MAYKYINFILKSKFTSESIFMYYSFNTHQNCFWKSLRT